MAFIALGVAILLVLILLPFFNNLIRTHLELPVSNSLMWVAVIAITLLTGLLAGSYPAIFLSSFKPIIVLKAQVQKNHSSVKPRQILVVTQFTFSVCLILFSLFIYRQINFVKQRSIGYKQDGLIEMNTEGSIANNFETFRQRGIDENALVDGALTSGTITNNASSTWGVSWPGILPGEENIPIDQIAVTYHFINTYGLQLSEGRDYDISRPADSNGIILNEAAVKLMRLEDPLGKQIKYHDTLRTIIGIVKDFVWGSPFEPVKPAIIGFIKNWRSEIGLRLNPLQPVSKSLATLAGLYKQFNPKYPFVYTFAEDEFTQKFNTEKLLGTMASGFTALAIIISCLGLFGLASFSARQKRKEIGIRKVLGSSVGHIWLRLSGEFIKLIFISFLIGSIASWYLIGTWLSSYTYHTSLDLWLFVATLLLSVLLCLLTVSWQAIKAALTNPVSSLRTE
jgi:putative ABC transport system permease protein